jgi:hypothetical protein
LRRYIKAPELEVRRAGVEQLKKFSDKDIVPIDLALNG